MDRKKVAEELVKVARDLVAGEVVVARDSRIGAVPSAKDLLKHLEGAHKVLQFYADPYSSQGRESMKVMNSLRTLMSNAEKLKL